MLIKSGIEPTVRPARVLGALGVQASEAQPTTPPVAGGAVDRLVDSLTRGAETLVYEGTAVLQNDPALAVREFATRVHEGASRGYGSADLQAWAPYVGVGARTLIFGANVIRAQTSLKDPTKGLLERSLDVARVATDLAGVAGAVLRVVSPKYAGLGTSLMGIAQSADLVSHGARFGLHAAPRVKAWLTDQAQKRAKKKLEGNEPPAKPLVAAQPPLAPSLPVAQEPITTWPKPMGRTQT